MDWVPGLGGEEMRLVVGPCLIILLGPWHKMVKGHWYFITSDKGRAYKDAL